MFFSASFPLTQVGFPPWLPILWFRAEWCDNELRTDETKPKSWGGMTSCKWEMGFWWLEFVWRLRSKKYLKYSKCGTRTNHFLNSSRRSWLYWCLFVDAGLQGKFGSLKILKTKGNQWPSSSGISEKSQRDYLDGILCLTVRSFMEDGKSCTLGNVRSTPGKCFFLVVSLFSGGDFHGDKLTVWYRIYWMELLEASPILIFQIAGF